VDLDAVGGPLVTPLLDDGEPNHTVMVGPAGSVEFGFSVAVMPDIDGDLVPDIIVGAWQDDIDDDSFATCTPPPDPEPRISFGGSATVFSPGSQPNAGAKILMFYGEEGRDHLGRAVAAADLFGSSGRPEIILSGVAWTPPGFEAPFDPTELGKGNVWDGDTVLP